MSRNHQRFNNTYIWSYETPWRDRSPHEGKKVPGAYLPRSPSRVTFPRVVTLNAAAKLCQWLVKENAAGHRHREDKEAHATSFRRKQRKRASRNPFEVRIIRIIS